MIENFWIPDEVQMDKPSIARIYDCLLGGYHNFEIDRLVAKKVLEIYPDSNVIKLTNWLVGHCEPLVSG